MVYRKLLTILFLFILFVSSSSLYSDEIYSWKGEEIIVARDSLNCVHAWPASSKQLDADTLYTKKDTLYIATHSIYDSNLGLIDYRDSKKLGLNFYNSRPVILKDHKKDEIVENYYKKYAISIRKPISSMKNIIKRFANKDWRKIADYEVSGYEIIPSADSLNSRVYYRNGLFEGSNKIKSKTFDFYYEDKPSWESHDRYLREAHKK